ncbi:MAG: universal stress protein [Gemmatimonadota bacterium]
MLHSILVPLDGSHLAESVLPTAANLARAAGAKLRLLMVHEPRIGSAFGGISNVLGPDDSARRAIELTYLAATAHQLGAIGSGPVIPELVDGAAAAAIQDVVARHPPDLIVMSTHGRGALSRFWLGSVADRLIRLGQVPILLFRPPADGVPAKPLELRRVLVPIDLSKESEAILDIVKALARATQAHVTLLNVVEPMFGALASLPYPVAMQPEPVDALRTEAQRYLDQVGDRLRKEGLEVATNAVIGIGTAATILRQLEDGRFDLIALSTNGAGGFRRVVLGSVADKVIRAAPTPVLVYRPAETANH